MLPSFLANAGQPNESSGSAYTKLAAAESHNEIPLLPTSRQGLDDDEELRVGERDSGDDGALAGIYNVWHANLVIRIILILVGTIIAFVLVSLAWAFWPENTPYHPDIPQLIPQPHDQVTNATQMSPTERAHQKVKALFAEQSTTLAEARSRYTLKTGHNPPKHYDSFYKFAKERKCLIDNYDQIYDDFAPFYQLAEENPAWFRQRLQHGLDLSSAHNVALKGWQVSNGKGEGLDSWDASYTDDWRYLFGEIPAPNMSMLLNNQDEPRVVFNIREPNAHKQALTLNDTDAFMNVMYGTANYFGIQGDQHCLFANSPNGFGDLANDKHAFLLSTTTSRFSKDLYPVLSMAKISPCFADIVVPHSYNYQRSTWSTKFAYPDNVAWKAKKSMGYWHGAASGGMIINDNYHQFQRFRLVDIAREHPTLFDVGITDTSQWTCKFDCPESKLKQEYGIKGTLVPKEDTYKFKYAIDVDGNSFSGRFVGLLKSGSLVFKSTVFTEHHSQWFAILLVFDRNLNILSRFRPYEHYIPVLPDLSDLVHKIEWAIANDAEAQMIQQAGKVMAEALITDVQNDCYYLAVLVEHANLQHMGES